MKKLPWIPWHQVVDLKDESVSELATVTPMPDIFDVAMRRGRQPMYDDPAKFFEITYPTRNLCRFVKGVLLRLTGSSNKAVHTFRPVGGTGKTHALIALYHFVSGSTISDKTTAARLTHDFGLSPPRTRVAVLALDRLDEVAGIAVLSPDGQSRRFKFPWSVIAFQLAGLDGLGILGDPANERADPPSLSAIEELLATTGRESFSTLLAIDIASDWSRAKIEPTEPPARRMLCFFADLVRAVTRVDCCALVAPLLADDPAGRNSLWSELAHQINAILSNDGEAGLEPVVKGDIGSILKHRFFRLDEVDPEWQRSQANAALAGVIRSNDQTKGDLRSAESLYMASYPFHPDLIELLCAAAAREPQGLHRLIRVIAVGLREARVRDESPLIGVGALLNGLDLPAVSKAVRLLAELGSETARGEPTWTDVLEVELSNAREIQSQWPDLSCREIEQAVLITFLYSKLRKRPATVAQLMRLLVQARPKKTDVEQALRWWIESSSFLAESDFQMTAADQHWLPETWRLSLDPNLQQRQREARIGISSEMVDLELAGCIRKQKLLTTIPGAKERPVRIHLLPSTPDYVVDDMQLSFVILGPAAASDPGKPSASACAYIDSRINRNSVILVTASAEGLANTRSKVRDYLAWQQVNRALEQTEDIDPRQHQMLRARLDQTWTGVISAVHHAYCIAVATGEHDDIQAYRITAGDEPTFEAIIRDARLRIQTEPIKIEALLPGGEFGLWAREETSRSVDDLVGAFARCSRLPRILDRKAIIDELATACLDGLLVLRTRNDGRTGETFWRRLPPESVLQSTGVEVVLTRFAILPEINPELLRAGCLPGLWKDSSITAARVYDYFSDASKEGDSKEHPSVPRVDPQVLAAALKSAVKQGLLWLREGPISLFAEEVPNIALTDNTRFEAPPPVLSALDVMPERIESAWKSNETNAAAIRQALSNRDQFEYPWITIVNALEGAFRAGLLDRSQESGPWPCDLGGAESVIVRRCAHTRPKFQAKAVAEATLTILELQDLCDVAAELIKICANHELVFRVRIELGGDNSVDDQLTGRANCLLKDISEELQLR